MPELCEAFRLTCDAYDRCFILIDALDECKSHGHRTEIVRALKSLPAAKTSVLVTSRPHPHDIQQYFVNELRIHVEASEADIKHYCSSMIEVSASATNLLDAALRQQVMNDVASKAHGM